MNEIQVFQYDDQQVRTVVIDDAPWFVGRDVAMVLGYRNPQEAIRNHVDAEDKGVSEILTPGGRQKAPIINESGVYSLILSSKLPSAKRFKHWVTSEVLPSIRKHGAFMTPAALEQAMHDPDFIIRLATEIKNERQRNLALQIENDTLAMKTRKWDDRVVLTALVRAYAGKVYGGQFHRAWGDFYREFNYREHVNIRARHTKQKGKKGVKSLADCIRPEELPRALRYATAMCEAKGVDAAEILFHMNKMAPKQEAM